jgi:hypothetical protein
MKVFIYVALLVLYLLHNDLWYWYDFRVIGGFPIGLLFHVAYCFVAAVLLFLLIKFAWPEHLEIADRT